MSKYSILNFTNILKTIFFCLYENILTKKKKKSFSITKRLTCLSFSPFYIVVGYSFIFDSNVRNFILKFKYTFFKIVNKHLLTYHKLMFRNTQNISIIILILIQRGNIYWLTLHITELVESTVFSKNERINKKHKFKIQLIRKAINKRRKKRISGLYVKIF